MTLTLTKSNQRGVVLVASLLVLLVVTVIGTSTFRDVGLQEKMAGNFRVKARTFEVTNSALQQQWIQLMETQGTEKVTDIRTRTADTQYDLSNADLAVATTTCYQGSDIAPGTDEDYRTYQFRVTSTATDSTGARSSIRQGGYVIAEKATTDPTGSCP